jgi:hypothetical protein
MYDGDRSPYGLVTAAFGAALLAVGVFLPWYGVSFTAGGVAEARDLTEQLASHYGNSAFQGLVQDGASHFNSFIGRELGAVSGHQALKYMSIVLLVLAALALLDSLAGLAGARPGAGGGGAGASLVLVGLVASVCVAYRLVSPPSIPTGLFSVSLREGGWVALLGALLILAGGLWPRVRVPSQGAVEEHFEGALSGLSGWTPQS